MHLPSIRLELNDEQGEFEVYVGDKGKVHCVFRACPACGELFISISSRNHRLCPYCGQTILTQE